MSRQQHSGNGGGVSLRVIHKHKRNKTNHDTEERDANQPLATRGVQNHNKENVQTVDLSRRVTEHLCFVVANIF